MPPLYGYSLPKMKTSSFSDGSRGEKKIETLHSKTSRLKKTSIRGENKLIKTKGEETGIQNTMKIEIPKHCIERYQEFDKIKIKKKVRKITIDTRKKKTINCIEVYPVSN